MFSSTVFYDEGYYGVSEALTRRLKCLKCNEYLIPTKTNLKYLGHKLSYELPCCPKCGKVFVSEEIAKGKMHEVETELEDK